MAGSSSRYAYLTEKYGEEAEYILVDFFDQLTYFGFYYDNSDIFLKQFLETYNGYLAYEVDNIALWIKGKGRDVQLISTVDEFPQKLAGPNFANEHIRFVGCNFEEKEVLERSVLHIESYLESLRSTDKRYVLALDFYDKDNKKLIYRHWFTAADRIYPTKRWKRFEKIKISQNVFIPESVNLKECELVLNFATMK